MLGKAHSPTDWAEVNLRSGSPVQVSETPPIPRNAMQYQQDWGRRVFRRMVVILGPLGLPRWGQPNFLNTSWRGLGKG